MIQKAEAVQTAIDALAAKPAVPVSHLWAVLTAQARIEAWTAVAWAVLTPVGWFIWWRLLSWARTNADDAKQRDSEWVIVPFVIGVFGGIAMSGATVGVLIGLFAAVGYVVNPEYYAIKQILGALK